MKYVIEQDDMSPFNHQFPLYEELREHYPNFKVSMFTTTWDIRFGETKPITDVKFDKWCDAVRQAVKDGWMEICIHGLTHAPLEFGDLSAEGAWKRVVVAEKFLDNREIPYVKIFKAPFWALSKEAEQRITEMGYRVVHDGYYHWNLSDDEPAREGAAYTVAHGHVNNVCNNGIEQVIHKLMKLPPNSEFAFLSEYLGVTNEQTT